MNNENGLHKDLLAAFFITAAIIIVTSCLKDTGKFQCVSHQCLATSGENHEAGR